MDVYKEKMEPYLQLLDNQTDIRSRDIPIIKHGPWFTLLLLIVLNVLYTYTINLMKNRSPYLMKPYQIVYYGLFFGVYGISVPLAFVLSENGSLMFRCDLTSELSLISLARVYASFTYFLLKLLAPFDLIIMILVGEVNNINMALFIDTFLLPLAIYTQIKFYPGGILLFHLTCDALFSCIKYGILTRRSSFLSLTIDFIPILHNLKRIEFALMTLHSIYSTVISDCNCPRLILIIMLIINLSIFIAYCIYPARRSTSTSSVIPSETSSLSPILSEKIKVK